MEDEIGIELPSELRKMQSEKRVIGDGPKICHVVIGGSIDSDAFRALLEKSVRTGEILRQQVIDGEVLDIPPRQLFKSFDPRGLTMTFGHIEHDLMSSMEIKDTRVTKRQQKRGAFDRTGTSPGATIGKKPKWWER